MNFEQMTDQAIATELGHRIEQRRLEKNLTQQEVADEVGLSRISYRKLEAGEGKLINFIAVLRVLGEVSSLENLIPESVFSPMEQLKLKGKVRKRASKVVSKAANKAASKESNNDQELDW